MNITGCRAITDEEMEKILAAMDGRHALRDRAVLVFGAKTGFRISEIMSLTVASVWENGAIKNSVTVRKENMKGGEKSRTMPLHRDAQNALATYLRAAKLDHDFHARTALFPRQGSTEPLDPRAYWRIIKDAARRAGVDAKRIGTHTMRKCFASKLWPRMGGDILKLATVLGHQNPTNSARYVQFLDGSLERAVLE